MIDTGKSPREKKLEAPTNLPPKAVTAQQPRPVSSPSGSREEALTEGQEFYRAADILQAEPPPAYLNDQLIRLDVACCRSDEESIAGRREQFDCVKILARNSMKSKSVPVQILGSLMTSYSFKQRQGLQRSMYILIPSVAAGKADTGGEW